MVPGQVAVDDRIPHFRGQGLTRTGLVRLTFGTAEYGAREVSFHRPRFIASALRSFGISSMAYRSAVLGMTLLLRMTYSYTSC